MVLKHQGRSTLVELPVSDSSQDVAEPVMPAAEPSTLTELLEQPDSTPQETQPRDASLGEGVALVRRALWELGICFLMAPRHHSAMRNVAGPRITSTRSAVSGEVAS